MLRSCFAGLTLVLASSHAEAQPEKTSEDLARTEELPTFAYTTPAEPHALRAVLELGGVLALGFTWYATTSTDIVRDWDVGYSFTKFRDKITGRAFGPDTNHFGTNFIGHPLGGTGYYLAARSNRLSILQSFGFSVAGSLLWELFGEVSEIVSLNDTLVTPLGGLAIGESTMQLASFFDRSDATLGHRVAGTFFGPFKTMNDAFDGLTPARASLGFPVREWHRFDLTAEATVVHERLSGAGETSAWPELRLGLGSRLVRLPGYTRSGSETTSFDDGNASNMRLDAAFGRAGLSDLSYATEVVLAGGYYRARTLDSRGKAWGGNGFIGLAFGFGYSLHDYARANPGPIDRWAAIRPAGVVFEQRGALGGPELVTRLDVGADFGGVRAFATPPLRPEPGSIPPVLVRHGYYFGLGGHLATSATLEIGRFELTGAVAAEGLRAVGGPREGGYLRLEDWRSRALSRVAYRIPRTVAVLQATAEHRHRRGRAGNARNTASELSLGLGGGAVF